LRSASSAASILASGLDLLGFDHPERLCSRLLEFGKFLLQENEHTNLVGAKSIEDLIAAHFLDSLAVARLVSLASPVADIGSGAGFPGIPIALAYPELSLTLFEPRRKRAEFLKSAISLLQLGTVTVEQTTAETAGRAAWRGRARTVLTRAVGRPLVALELGLPLLQTGGFLVMYVGRQAAPSSGERRMAAYLGGDLTEARAVSVPYLDAERHTWVFRKDSNTPQEYPRRSGVPPVKEPMFPVEQSPQAFDRVLLDALPKANVFSVGGRVRDEMLAKIGRPQTGVPDLDYLVTGISLDDLLTDLRHVGRAELVGAAFGVVKFSVGGATVDVALPRRERSVGPHHRDFEIESDKDIPIEDDLARRDFRMNMMARNLRTGTIIDPYGGRADLERSRLDVLREEAFVEDPLRVLRGAQFAARFELEPTTTARKSGAPEHRFRAAPGGQRTPPNTPGANGRLGYRAERVSPLYRLLP
jgi:16S rRNA (guanine527-N7)-methyltransferase